MHSSQCRFQRQTPSLLFRIGLKRPLLIQPTIRVGSGDSEFFFSYCNRLRLCFSFFHVYSPLHLIIIYYLSLTLFYTMFFFYLPHITPTNQAAPPWTWFCCRSFLSKGSFSFPLLPNCLLIRGHKAVGIVSVFFVLLYLTQLTTHCIYCVYK